MVWHSAVAAQPVLSGRDGDLVLVRISTAPRSLESLLDCLANLTFPVNPELFHGVPTYVEFPAYQSKVGEIRDALRAYGFDPGALKVTRMIDVLGD